MGELSQLVRDLIRFGVELLVADGQPALHVPETMPESDRRRAYRAARAGLEVLTANRDRVAEVWRAVAKEVPDPDRCRECMAWIFRVPEPVSRWAFCTYRGCTYRTDGDANDYRWARQKKQQTRPGQH